MNTSAARPIFITLAVISLTAGIVLSAFMLSRFMLKIQHSTEKCITVKGVAEKTVTSDIAAFTCNVSVKGNTRAEAYNAIDKAKRILLAQLNRLGFSAAMREDERLSCEERYHTVKTRVNGKEETRSYFDHYRMTYSVRIRTNNVSLVEKNHLRIYELAAYKMEISHTSPRYFISNPEQYKLELMDSASASAAARATVAARKGGSTLGPLMEARQGVIQITAPASNETSDYGIYDTGSIQKVIRLVVTMKFSIK